MTTARRWSACISLFLTSSGSVQVQRPSGVPGLDHGVEFPYDQAGGKYPPQCFCCHQYYTQNHLPNLSFEIDGPAQVTIPASQADVAAAHAALLTTTRQLNKLVAGPTATLMSTNVRTLYRLCIGQSASTGQ